MQPTVLSTLAQSLPPFTTVPGLNPQQKEQKWLHPHPAPAETHRRPAFVPQVQPRPEFEDTLTWWFRSRPSLPSSWRVREIERQREMDRIAEPYIARLQEVSRQKKVDAEACALAGQQRKERAEEGSGNPSRYFLEEDKKKAQKELKEIERQQRSEEKRQARKGAREERRRRKSAENTSGSPGVRETEVRRKSPSRSKPYSIPHPAIRSPRRSHVMPGGFDSDDLASDQTGLTSDDLWKSLKSAVGMGYRFWMQSQSVVSLPARSQRDSARLSL